MTMTTMVEATLGENNAAVHGRNGGTQLREYFAGDDGATQLQKKPRPLQKGEENEGCARIV